MKVKIMHNPGYISFNDEKENSATARGGLKTKRWEEKIWYHRVQYALAYERTKGSVILLMVLSSGLEGHLFDSYDATILQQ